jgi:hypothetical protein
MAGGGLRGEVRVSAGIDAYADRIAGEQHASPLPSPVAVTPERAAGAGHLPGSLSS